jgi:hypothetical protein
MLLICLLFIYYKAKYKNFERFIILFITIILLSTGTSPLPSSRVHVPYQRVVGAGVRQNAFFTYLSVKL